MNMQIDWHEELDSSFGAGRDLPPTDYLAPGRAALRRRRTAMGATVLAAVLVVGGIGWTFLPDRDGPRSSGIATDPSPTPTEDTRATKRKTGQEARAAAKPDFLGEPATYADDGSLALAPGWTAAETVTNPMGYTRPGWTSVGLRVVRGGEEKFVLVALQTDRNGSGTSVFSNDAVGSLDAWLDGTVASQRTLDEVNSARGGSELTTPDMQPVVMKPNGEFHAFGGVTVLATRTGAALPEPLRALGETVVAAQVQAADGSIQWVLGWVLDSEPDEVISTAEFADLDAFVAWAAQQHASGQGLR